MSATARNRAGRSGKGRHTSARGLDISTGELLEAKDAAVRAVAIPETA